MSFSFDAGGSVTKRMTVGVPGIILMISMSGSKVGYFTLPQYANSQTEVN